MRAYAKNKPAFPWGTIEPYWNPVEYAKVHLTCEGQWAGRLRRQQLQPGNGKWMGFIPKDICDVCVFSHVTAIRILEDIRF